MEDNSIRQLVYPRIGEYADCQTPEPVHDEINVWQHVLNVIYQEALPRKLTEDVLEVLSSPLQVINNDQPRQVISTATSIYPEGTGDRARQS